MPRCECWAIEQYIAANTRHAAYEVVPAAIEGRCGQYEIRNPNIVSVDQLLDLFDQGLELVQQHGWEHVARLAA